MVLATGAVQKETLYAFYDQEYFSELCIRSSERYSFQCTSATYYHKERDCVLNLGNRQLTPDIFVANDQQQKPENRLTYLGLVCNPAKAIDKHVNNELVNGCTPGSARDETSNSVTIPTVLRTAAPAAHTDQCFLELPNHVLEGTALAIETNVTVEECKCFCVDSEHRYGTECQSLQYYFDSQTCLLNKENRITDPDRFNYDPGSNVMHSYFDYKCHVEKVVLSAYIEQTCQMVIQISIKDVLNPPKTNPSLNIDDKSTEATRGLKAMDDTAKLKKLDNIDVKTDTTTSTKPTKPSTSKPKSKASTLSRKLRTTTSVPTTTDLSTTTTSTTTTTSPITTTQFEKLDSDSDENEEDFTELKFESTTIQNTPNLTQATNSSDQNQAVVLKTAKSITIFKKNKKKKQKTIIPEQEENEEEDMGSGQPSKEEDNNKSKSKSEEQEEVDNETHNDPVKAAGTSATPETTTNPTTSTTTTTPAFIVSRTTPFVLSTTTTTYPPVGPCRYSALYQTVFNGGRQLKWLMVTSPAQCFAACHAERCRSANLIQIEGTTKRCELFKDSIIEFRRTDVLSYDRGAVHFDSIQCDEA